MIDIDKFICALLEVKLNEQQKEYIKNSLRYVETPFKYCMFKVINALKEQGLEYKEGKIVEIEKKQ